MTISNVISFHGVVAVNPKVSTLNTEDQVTVISFHGVVAVNPKVSTLNTEDQVTVRQLARNNLIYVSVNTQHIISIML